MTTRFSVTRADTDGMLGDGRDGTPTWRSGDRLTTPQLLVVNDEQDNREMLAHRLRERGYAVRTASDGYGALEAIEAHDFDLVLLDVRMPGMDGLEVLRRIREKHSMNELPVMMASALAESQAVIQALELGANDYVTEPIDFAVALARIHNVLRSSASAMRASRQSTPPSSLGEGSVLDDRYRLDGVLGSGGFANVYRGTQLSTGQRVAIKILHAGRWDGEQEAAVGRRRFELEMRLIGEINHPSVVRLLDSGTVVVGGRGSAPPPEPPVATRSESPHAPPDEGPHPDHEVAGTDVEERLPYLVMELLEGETLEAALKRLGRFEVQEAVDLLLPVISGVGAAHRRGAIHRDLKPANIFLAELDGQIHPKVLDFGIAKLADEVGRRRLTQTAALIGTPEYMAPEQACGKELTVRCDQFTLATVLFECVTGQRAFEGRSMIDVVRKVAEGRLPDVADHVEAPASFRQALQRASDPDPDARFPSIEQFGVALLDCASPSVRSRWEAPLTQGSSPHRNSASSSTLAAFTDVDLTADTLVASVPPRDERNS